MGTDEAPFLPVLWGPTVDFDDSGAPVFHRVRQLLKVGIGDGCHFSCNAAIRSAWVFAALGSGGSRRVPFPVWVPLHRESCPVVLLWRRPMADSADGLIPSPLKLLRRGKQPRNCQKPSRIFKQFVK